MILELALEGAFEPKIPPYAEPLTELIQRIALSAPAAADLPRLADHYLLATMDSSVNLAPVPAPNVVETGRLLRLIASFLEHQAQMPTALLQSLRMDSQQLQTGAVSSATDGSTRAPEQAAPSREASPRRSAEATDKKRTTPPAQAKRPRDRRESPTLFSDDR